MKIALIIPDGIGTGVGRYIKALFGLSNRSNDRIDFYPINRIERALYRISDNSKDLIMKINSNSFINNIIIKKLKLSGLRDLFLIYRLGKAIPDRYDLYHITCQDLSCLNWIFKTSKIIITVHDVIYHTLPGDYRQRYLGKLIYKGIKKADFIIAISNSTKIDLMEHFNIPEKKIKVIYCGLDEGFKKLNPDEFQDLYFKYNLSKDYRYILHVGGGARRKNLLGVLKSLYRLIHDYNLEDIRLLAIDDIDSNLIKNLGLDDYVKIVGRVYGEDLVKFYNLACLLVFPSFYEGFGFPPLEAMGCGTPVIVSNTSSLPEVVSDAGILVNPNDIDSLTQAIYGILTNEKLRQDLIVKGINRAKLFTWQKCIQETLEVYNRFRM